ncbi:MAG: zinc ribbon domain-containing protein [Bacilli bacterium]|nr:zinc ribbon domain-containing protein [Bacilli bacterium]
MKCRYCNKDISENVNFCIYCGEANDKTLDQKIDDNLISSNSWTPPKNNNAVNNSLITGVIALFFGFFIGNFFGLVAIVLGVFAIIYGVKGIKAGAVKKSVLGATFGFLGILFGIIFLIKIGIQTRIILTLDEKYEEKFNLMLPSDRPDAYVLNDNLLPRYSFNVNEFHYNLESEELETLASDLYSSNTGWIWYPMNPYLSTHFSELELKTNEGLYFYYDNKLESTVVKELDDDYDIVIIIIDSQSNKLSIYEIWMEDVNV